MYLMFLPKYVAPKEVKEFFVFCPFFAGIVDIAQVVSYCCYALLSLFFAQFSQKNSLDNTTLFVLSNLLEKRFFAEIAACCFFFCHFFLLLFSKSFFAPTCEKELLCFQHKAQMFLYFSFQLF